MLARKDGEARLAALNKGEDKLVWGAAKRVSRLDHAALPPAAVPTVFRMETTKLPVFAGVELPGSGYALFRLNKVEAGEALDEARKQSMLNQLATLEMQEEVQSYLAALRSRYKVEVNKNALDVKDK